MHRPLTLVNPTGTSAGEGPAVREVGEGGFYGLQNGCMGQWTLWARAGGAGELVLGMSPHVFILRILWGVKNG